MAAMRSIRVRLHSARSWSVGAVLEKRVFNELAILADDLFADSGVALPEVVRSDCREEFLGGLDKRLHPI